MRGRPPRVDAPLPTVDEREFHSSGRAVSEEPARYHIRDTGYPTLIIHTRAEPSFGLLAIPLSRFPHLVRLLDDGSDLFISHRAAERVRPRNGSEGRRTFRRSATLLISPLLPIPRGLISQGAYGRIGRSRKNQTKSILPNNKQCDAKGAVPSFGG